MGPLSMNGVKAFFLGGALAIVTTFVFAPVLALVYRFPIPLGGYLGGPRAVWPAMYAVYVYGWYFRGFVVVGVLAGVAAVVAYVRAAKRGRGHLTSVVAPSLCVSFLSVLLLAILDKLVGSW